MGEPIKLSVKPLSLSERKKRRLEGLAVSLDDKDPKYVPAGDPHAILMKAAVPTDQPSAEAGKDQSVKDAPSDRRTVVPRILAGESNQSTTVPPWHQYPGFTVKP